MIAAVDHSQKAVWGWGNTRQQAHDHAAAERAEKKPGVTWNKLDYCELRQGANLEDGGFEAYKYLLTTDSSEGQLSLL
ncbi:hypothetical protein [Microbulbifer agarilyticus]